MNTSTVNPESTINDADRTEPYAPGPGRAQPSGFGPDRAALRRPSAGRVLAGVAEGLARYFGMDPTIVRIVFVVLTIVGGAGIPLYLAGLLLIPDEGSGRSIAGSVVESLESRSR